jgi:NAD(P)H-dependent FMN reductase
MSQTSLNVLAVVGSLNRTSATRAVIKLAAERLRAAGAQVDVLDLPEEPLPLFNPDDSHAREEFPGLKARVELADVYLLGTPDYHGSMSSTLKNFLDHFWREFAGKLFASIVASHDKGLTVTDQIRTVARQCYAWSMPYAVAFAEKSDFHDGQIVSDTFQRRLEMLVHDVRVYGELLARQRRADLAGRDPGFMARSRQ